MNGKAPTLISGQPSRTDSLAMTRSQAKAMPSAPTFLAFAMSSSTFADAVPFVTALVPEVDLVGGRVVVADRPGLVTAFPEDLP